jgi:hypothetical protein
VCVMQIFPCYELFYHLNNRTLSRPILRHQKIKSNSVQIRFSSIYEISRILSIMAFSASKTQKFSLKFPILQQKIQLTSKISLKQNSFSFNSISWHSSFIFAQKTRSFPANSKHPTPYQKSKRLKKLVSNLAHIIYPICGLPGRTLGTLLPKMCGQHAILESNRPSLHKMRSFVRKRKVK